MIKFFAFEMSSRVLCNDTSSGQFDVVVVCVFLLFCISILSKEWNSFNCDIHIELQLIKHRLELRRWFCYVV